MTPEWRLDRPSRCKRDALSRREMAGRPAAREPQADVRITPTVPRNVNAAAAFIDMGDPQVLTR